MGKLVFLIALLVGGAIATDVIDSAFLGISWENTVMVLTHKAMYVVWGVVLTFVLIHILDLSPAHKQ